MAVRITPIAGTGVGLRGLEAGLRWEAARTALIEALPMLIAIAPFGMTIGVAVGATSVHDAAGWSGSLLLFAGSAHLAAVSMLGAGAGGLAVVATVIAINARLAVYSASLAPSFRAQPRWFRWLAPYFLVDQVYALVSARIADGKPAEWVRWYYLGLAAGLLAVWPAAIAVGVLAGPVIPQGWQLGFAAPALLVGLLVPALGGRAALSAAAVAAIAAVGLAALPSGLGLLAGGAAGTVTGMTIERIGR